VPGDHDSMVLVPNVAVLAKRLRQLIDTADKPSAPPHFHYADDVRKAAE